MGAPLRVLCVHGIGDQHTDLSWQDAWRTAITEGVRCWNAERHVEVEFVVYDDLFAARPVDPATLAGALWKLATSGVIHGIGDLFRRERGLEQVPHVLRWTAGMIAQWADDDVLRAQTRARVLQRVAAVRPDVVCAHSLGSLVCYDTFVRDDGRAAIAGRTFVSFGSQIGNPFVRSTLGGRIEALQAECWYHLFNADDHVFTRSLRISSERFVEIDATFDRPDDPLNHDAPTYLQQPNVVSRVWRALSGAPVPVTLTRSMAAFRAVERRPPRRALLIGINEYPQPENRLEGCVNDVFLMSAVLQERGFAPEDIRVVLDVRATADAIEDRLHWLLDDVRSGDERVLYYSGHGAQIPAYGAREEVDHLDECLVPYDFDWSRERAITDDHLFDLYSQLPYDSRLLAVFDCCHSGGMTRAGNARVRGIEPPDDIRHRALRWDARLEMWRERKLDPAMRDTTTRGRDAYVGESGATHRLGRAIPLRTLPSRQYDRQRRSAHHLGPFLPIIIEACREDQLSYEYRHGVTSYGAFTFALSTALRRARRRGRGPTFEAVTRDVTDVLRDLGFDQTPCLVGPKSQIESQIPTR